MYYFVCLLFISKDLRVASDKKQRVLEEEAQKLEQQKKLERLKKKVLSLSIYTCTKVFIPNFLTVPPPPPC